MSKEYLLDTNAYFNLLRELGENGQDKSAYSEQINTLKNGEICISSITKVEIISVLGKYARGKNGGFQECTRCVSQPGEKCQNQWYIAPRAKWNRRKIQSWLQLIKETTDGSSHLLSVHILPFDENTIRVAEQIIPNALIHSFASMDAMIAATAKEAILNGKDMTVVTSDGGLKACMDRVPIPYWDAFQV